MLKYLKYTRKFATIRPRTCWFEIPFYTIVNGFKQRFNFGYRPEDLAKIDAIDQKTWEKHQSYRNRLDRFPLDKAEYYLRIKESYGINSIRELAKMIGEDWSCVPRILKVLNLSDPIKDFLRNKKNDPDFIKFFNLRRHLEIVRQGEDRSQLVCFRVYMEEFEESCFLVR